MTPVQHRLFVFIDSFITKNGFGPSFREMQHAIGAKTKSYPYAIVDGLVAAGYLKKANGIGSSRNLTIIKRPGDDLEIAVLRERVAALEKQLSGA